MVKALAAYQDILFWISGLSLFFFFFSLAAVPWLAARIPENYFKNLASGGRGIHGDVQSLPIKVLRNLAGIFLIAMGVIMLFIPGQGILTILFGLMLVDFPGKTSAVIYLVRKKGVQKAINWLREKKGVPPLRFPS